jgi:hypothetical protein
MLTLLLAAQLAAGDSTYATPALRDFVARAAAANRQAPATLRGYSARLESDMAYLVTDEKGREHAQQLEQVESELEWSRSGQVRQHVVGYRVRAGGMTVSALSVLRRPWVVAALYGDRLRLLVDLPRVPGLGGGWGRAAAIHPLAADRDAVYRFSGGDTIVQLKLQGRTVPVVRVHVTPRPDRADGRLLLFEGDLDLAADRSEVVRMRGALRVVQARMPAAARLERLALRTALLVDLEEGEFRQRYWLPTRQRVEVQALSGLSNGFRPVARIVTTFRAQVLDTVPDALAGAAPAPAPEAAADTAAAATGRLSYAPNDSLNAFRGWVAEIGAASTGATAADFDDVVRPRSAPDAPPRVVWGADRFSDVLRYDKVEGLYTGLAGTWNGGAAAPGVTLAAHAGWAWQEGTARGAAALQRRRGRWTVGLTGRRELDNTNDFVPTLEGPATIGALTASIDDYDYVDRAELFFHAARALDAGGRRVVRYEIGPGRDDAATDHVTQGIIRVDSVFRPNRTAARGGYLRQAVTFELNPEVSGEYLEPGLGAALSYERGDGGLRWQRLDARVAWRRTAQSFTWLARADGALLFGGSPPQKVIELGENEGLPGYHYKEFGGDRAALVRLGTAYALPFFRAPLRLRRWLTLPGPAPALTVGVQSGWAAAVAPATRAALEAFGTAPEAGSDPPRLVPVTRPTGGWRTTLGFSIDLFGGGIGIGVARPIDHAAPWVVILGSAQQW